MPDSVKAVKSGLYPALACTTPLVAWLLGHAWLAVGAQASLEAPLRAMLPAVMLLQAGTLALAMPRVLRYSGTREQSCGIGMLLLVPLPLYAVAWAAGAADAPTLIAGISLLGAFALSVYALYRVIVRVAPVGLMRSLLVRTSQISLPLLCWTGRGDWLRFLGL